VTYKTGESAISGFDFRPPVAFNALSLRNGATYLQIIMVVGAQIDCARNPPNLA